MSRQTIKQVDSQDEIVHLLGELVVQALREDQRVFKLAHPFKQCGPTKLKVLKIIEVE